MSLFEKLYSFIILVAVLLGIGLGQFNWINVNAELAIVPLLIAMLYLTFLQIPIESLKESIKNIRFTYSSLLINFLWTPILAWGLAMVFLSDHPALWLGFIMLMVTPCTDWYLIFTGIAKGNVALSTTILPLNLILQIVLLPVYIFIFSGVQGNIDMNTVLESVVLILLVPFLLAILTNFILRRKKYREKIMAKTGSLPVVFLSLAIMAMFASQGQILLENVHLLGLLLIPILLFFVINFLITYNLSKMLRFSYRNRVSFTMTTLARNSPIALAIAMTAFPEEPLIALTLVIGPLLELPILAGITQLLMFLYAKE